ncbi:hypothetical protein B9G55_18210 [Saccharibacillus sp. O16]|nr:hypothetical protein B9G55_18210 [Saccharibacillus sp. O16]
MNKKRIFYLALALVLFSVIGALISQILSNHRETDTAAAYGLAYVQQHYKGPNGLKVSDKCLPFFGSGMHEITIQDSDSKYYYLYVKVGPQDSLTSIEDATSYIRDKDYQFGCKK